MAIPKTPPGISILRWTFRTIRKVMMASRLARACSKKVKIVIGLFHNEEGDRGTCTESKGNEERFKEFTHPRIDMAGHDVTHRVGQSDSWDEGHDSSCDNQVCC